MNEVRGTRMKYINAEQADYAFITPTIAGGKIYITQANGIIRAIGLERITDPMNVDSDNDLLWDGDEYGVIEKDGYSNKIATMPSRQDSDGDGLFDGDELFPLNINLDRIVTGYETNPMNPDTDYDNLSDYDEIVKTLSNPINPSLVVEMDYVECELTEPYCVPYFHVPGSNNNILLRMQEALQSKPITSPIGKSTIELKFIQDEDLTSKKINIGSNEFRIKQCQHMRTALKYVQLQYHNRPSNLYLFYGSSTYGIEGSIVVAEEKIGVAIHYPKALKVMAERGLDPVTEIQELFIALSILYGMGLTMGAGVEDDILYPSYQEVFEGANSESIGSFITDPTPPPPIGNNIHWDIMGWDASYANINGFIYQYNLLFPLRWSDNSWDTVRLDRLFPWSCIYP
jgi:hypothetical protein